jgi:hypothetical protein
MYPEISKGLLKMGIKTTGLLFDAHFPYVDRRAYDLALEVLTDSGISQLVLGGDFADVHGLNSFGKNPHVEDTIMDEVECVLEEISLLDSLFKRQDKIFIEGNHCTRLERYILKKCPELFNFLTIPRLFKLAENGFKFIPDGPDQMYKISTLNVRHKPCGGGENFSNSTVKKAGASVIFGHHHQIQEHQTVTLDGDYHRAISVGCLCNKKHPVMSYVTTHHQWQLGFAIVTVGDDGKTWFCQNVHILQGKKYQCQANGRIYKN